MKQATRIEDEVPTVAKGKTQWDPIPVTYTELLSKLIDDVFIVPVHWVPFRAPFSRWYNANVWCDYHTKNPGHSTENCNSLKLEVQSLIKDGKLKFKELDGLVGVEDPSRAKTKMTRQEREAQRETSFEKASMPGDKVPIVKIGRNKIGCSSTIEGSKERLREHNGEEKKKVLQDLAQGLERMFLKQDECVTTLKEEHNSRALKRRWTLKSGDTWDGQTVGAKMEALAHDISQDDL